MNKYFFREVKNLTESKKRVMKNVLYELENTAKTPKHKWCSVLLTPVLGISLMAGITFFILNEIENENEQWTTNEQQSPPEKHIDFVKPTFSFEKGQLYIFGLTLGDSQESVIESLGEKYSIEQEDGSGADYVMVYDGVARLYFFEDKLINILLMKVDKKYFNQLFAEYEGFKFTSSYSLMNPDDDRFIYSKETNQILKATTNVPNKDLYLYLGFAGPELMENPDFIEMKQNLK
ncbi:hypothetical protein [Cytobacillus sp.]|uniref:hypothetical protein n=1 Tax=Cytobacillus sp. TaxID=2675269 RepID=UPI0028BD8120|nr:hypothetical protein [Cytobacillus sp.]